MRSGFLLSIAAFACSSHQVGTVMGAGVSTGAGVATATGAALAASAASRMLGGCYAICQQGEVCNPRTGLCDTLPCHGNCATGEKCEDTFLGEKCVGSPASVVAQPGASTRDSRKPAVRVVDTPPLPDGVRPDITQP
jgi:hypothetical protein